MIPPPVHEFVARTKETLGGNLISIILVGSFARGDVKPDSDIDLVLLVHEAGIDILKAVGRIVQGIDTEYEINPDVISETEFQELPELFNFHAIRLEGKVLYGRIPEDIIPAESELMAAKKTAVEALKSARHYLAVAEPPEKFSGGKLWDWVLKPLRRALRFYHYSNTGIYIMDFGQLAEEYPVLKLDPVIDHQQIIEESITICEKIMNT